MTFYMVIIANSESSSIDSLELLVEDFGLFSGLGLTGLKRSLSEMFIMWKCNVDLVPKFAGIDNSVNTTMAAIPVNEERF